MGKNINIHKHSQSIEANLQKKLRTQIHIYVKKNCFFEFFEIVLQKHTCTTFLTKGHQKKLYIYICYHGEDIMKEIKCVTPRGTSRNSSEIIGLYKTPLTKRRLYTSIRSTRDDRNFKFHTRAQTLY